MCDDIICEDLHLASVAGMDDITCDDLIYDESTLLILIGCLDLRII